MVPAPFRGQLSSKLFVTHGFDRNLLILTSDAFQEIYTSAKSLNIADPLARLLLRLILGSTYESGADPEGRMALSPELVEYASLKDEVLAVGQGDYFEIWSAILWDQQKSQIDDAETNASRFAQLNIATR